MAVTTTWKPGNGPISTDLGRADEKRSGPDRPRTTGPGPLAYLRPGRIAAETTPFAVADRGRWVRVRAA
ncbi:hypothetical protein AB0J86_06240 [Micromonospora sp. NPDC049559]|uniref:hypothetical protein n=1 Tax=Micromonospora sp. NPDC049559 TaxID=3155923 RepID=UPI003432C9AB